ncbi:MAG: DUF4159 domain-containing protein, partial [Candidatus Brocadiia bacterium]|nr:DUF4159 domain-containing protein [Candidatus Brocadiia bacterium]
MRTRQPPMARRAVVGVLAVLACLVPCRPGAGQDVTPEQLKAEMDELVEWIKAAQKDDGSWVPAGGQRRMGGWVLGNTSLAVLALSEAGVGAGDPVLSKGLAFILKSKAVTTYEATLKLMALESVDRKRYVKQMQPATTFLIETQGSSGGWGYSQSRSRPDNSCSQFAVLGLRSAARCGLEVPRDVWKRAWEHYARGQRLDGGWSYMQSGGESYGSMAAAGAASLYISASRMHLADRRCGEYIDDRRLQAGLGWLADNFSVTGNPGRGAFKFYYLYGLERVGVIWARRYLGRHDWYLEGVRHLVTHPNYKGGSGSIEGPLVRRCFALLFLAKGNNPVLIHKAQWDGDWNPHRYDAKFLVDHLVDLFEQRLAWQAVPLDAPLDHLAPAPILYISGSGRVEWSDEEVQRIKDYMETGGFVLVEANEGDAEFDGSFRAIIAEHFPDEDLEVLPADHPIYEARHVLPEDSRIRLEAIWGPCTTSLVYCPTGISCPWDVADQDAPLFKLGVNIVAYATGLERLSGKLERQGARLRLEGSEEAAALEGAFVVGRLVHGGDPRPQRKVWKRVLRKAHQDAGIALFSEPIALEPERDSLFVAHVLSLSGTRAFRLSEATKAKLRRYLERGGFIFAEATCGSAQFDRSFRALMADLFPARPLAQVPAGHPLLKLGRPLGEVRYTRAVLEERPGLTAPSLEYIELDGLAVVVYKKYDFSSAISGH